MSRMTRQLDELVETIQTQLKKTGGDFKGQQRRTADAGRDMKTKGKDLDNDLGDKTPDSKSKPNDPDTPGNTSPGGKRPKSDREKYVGRTPGKNSRTGREVQQRMRDEGTLRDNPDTGRPEVYDPRTGDYIDIKDTDMGHKHDAVDYWNTEGKYHGPKDQRVRDWMLDPKNYELEPAYGPGGNRSRGAQNGQTYDPPANLPAN